MKLKKSILVLAILSISTFVFADDNQTLDISEDQPQQAITPLQAENSNDLLVAPAPVLNSVAESQNFASAWGVSGQIGTLGLGINVAHALYSDYLDIRGQYNYLAYSPTIDGNQFKMNFGTAGLLLDYKPFGGVFRLTGGMYYDNRSLSVSGNNIDLGDGVTASGSASLNYPTISPYLGIGFGSYANSSVDKKGFLIAFDAGVMLSKATYNSNLTCSGGDCSDFDQQRQSFEDSVNSGLRSFPFYPVLSLSLGYRF